MAELPLRVLIQRANLDKSETQLLLAMVAHCSDGQHIFAFRDRLAAWAKLSTRHVDRLIHGYVDKRNGEAHKGLLARGVLTELVKARRGKSPAWYRINALALCADPRIESHLARDRERTRQMKLPGIVTPPKAGTPQQPVSDRSPAEPHRTPRPPASDTVSNVHGTPCPADLKAFPDLKACDLGELAVEIVGAIQSAPYELATTDSLLRAITGSLQALIKGGKSASDAAHFILAVTLDGIQRRQPINRFWFEDAKWRNVVTSRGYTSAAEERRARNIQNGRAAAGMIVALRAADRDANPECTSCHGTGSRASYSTPGIYEPCECIAPDAWWRTGVP